MRIQRTTLAVTSLTCFTKRAVYSATSAMAQELQCLPSPVIAVYLLGLNQSCMKSTCPHAACGLLLRRSTTPGLAECLTQHLEDHKPCPIACTTCAAPPKTKVAHARCRMCHTAISARSSRESTPGICFRCVPPSASPLTLIQFSCSQQELISEKLKLTIRIRKPSSHHAKRTPPSERLHVATRSSAHARTTHDGDTPEQRKPVN